MHHTILTISPNKLMFERLERIITGTLADGTVQLLHAHSCADIAKTLSGREMTFDLVVVDASSVTSVQHAVASFPSPALPGMRGDTTLIALSGEATPLDITISLIKAGASDLITTEQLAEELPRAITNALRLHHLQKNLKASNASAFPLAPVEIMGEDLAILHARKLANRAVHSEIPVFLQGEPGTGKELFARYIYMNSARAGRPFVTINALSLPDESLADPIIFGAVSYAQPGNLHPIISHGKLEEACGGTLFIREVGRLPLLIQAKLIHALQENRIIRAEDQKLVPLDVRIISSSSENLEQLVAEGRFLKELYYMLNVYPIQLPALRDRKGDVQLLIKHFYTEYTRRERKNLGGFAPSLMDKLLHATWPGNVRQLKNAIYRAVVLTPENTPITENAFPQQRMFSLTGDGTDALGTAPYNASFFHVPLLDERGNFMSIRAIEKSIIEHAIKYYDGHMSEVARRLKIGRSTLYRKMEEMGIAHPKGRVLSAKEAEGK
jgi:DNA-binding NtrC family response regulator